MAALLQAQVGLWLCGKTDIQTVKVDQPDQKEANHCWKTYNQIYNNNISEIFFYFEMDSGDLYLSVQCTIYSLCGKYTGYFDKLRMQVCL